MVRAAEGPLPQARDVELARHSTAADTNAASSSSGGRKRGRRCANMDLPVPAGPVIKIVEPIKPE